jgi:hypothetical protein
MLSSVSLRITVKILSNTEARSSVQFDGKELGSG